MLQQYFTLISVQNRGRGEIGRERKKKKGSSDDILSVCKFHEKNIANKKDVFIEKIIQFELLEKFRKKLEIRKKKLQKFS